MRVLLVNAFHWLKGGVERTYFDESRWLAAAGHEVSHFATADPRNAPSPTARFFPPGVDFSEAGSPLAQLAALPHAMWSARAADALAALVAEHRPDVAHLHAPSRHLTPSIFAPLQRAGVPVVMTLHDFKPWCTNRLLYAHGEICERCRGGHHWRAVATGCVQGSRAKSAVAAFEAYLHDAWRAYASVRTWIAPSRFVYDKALTFDVPEQRLRVLSHGVEAMPAASSPETAVLVASLPARYALFAGRLSVEKGVRLLPDIARAIAPDVLVVCGDGPLGAWLDQQALPNVRRAGHVDDGTLAALRARAAVVVAPSLFVEHFGYSVAEALLDRRPVVAARIGALPELVEHEVTGLVAEPGDGTTLGAHAKRALTDTAAAAAWGEAGRARVLAMSAPAAHLNGLLAIYEEAMHA
ncbi:MAG: glycosyltransferase [Candidatus Eisenbacteria bacterium]